MLHDLAKYKKERLSLLFIKNVDSLNNQYRLVNT